MFNTLLFSILLFSVCIVSLASGILLLQNNHKAPANGVFFAMIIAVNFWSAGLALAILAPNVEICEIWRRFSAIGWGTFYAIFLHFILIITGRMKFSKKWWFYLLLYAPALITVFAFAVPNHINPLPYQLHQTEYGWVNVAENNIWDWLFYAYYISYTIMGLLFVLIWGKKSSDDSIKRQSRIISLAILCGLVLASLTDVVLSSIFVKLPQMAPVIMLIPILAIYHTLRKSSFEIADFFNKKSSYVNITASVILYVIISFFQIYVAVGESHIIPVNFEENTFRGILLQLQMLISLYLVLKENKPGYIASVLMNSANLIGNIVFMLRSNSSSLLPGIISYLAVLMIITLIINYKDKTAAYIDRINSQRKSLEESEKTLYKMAYFDSLTGLPNRDWFLNQLSQSIHVARRNASLIGVMFIDFDSFKSVNDTAGHATGDIVLCQIANRISSCLREEDTIARFGGDEFIVKVAGIENFEDLQKISDRIINAFKNPISVQDYEYFISASIGVAVYPIDGEDAETLIKNADIAMYAAKSKERNQCVYCTSHIKEDIIRKMKLTNSLYRALDNNELFLHYQPQVNVETQDICGFEALLRWNSEEYGFISPRTFIPMAEQTGLIRPIGLWVINTACEQLKKFRSIYNKDLSISINLSLLQLKDPGIAAKIRKILDQTETNPKNVLFEITESTVFNEEPYVLQQLQDIKNLGALICIDDFGTGYSSFSRLKTFPIDLIKIDTEFVQAISSKSHKDSAIIKSIIQIAKNLKVEVLAEGVETEDQFKYLKERKCDKIQGFYFYKPMAAEEIESILK